MCIWVLISAFVCLLLKIASVILVPWDADNLNASKEKEKNGGEGVGGFPFCLHVAQDYHAISPRV